MVRVLGARSHPSCLYYLSKSLEYTPSGNFAAAYKSAQRHRGSCQLKRIFVRCAKRPPCLQKSCKSKVALLPSTDRVSLACATANDAVGSSDGTMGRSTLPEPQWRRWVSEQQPRRVRLDPIGLRQMAKAEIWISDRSEPVAHCLEPDLGLRQFGFCMRSSVSSTPSPHSRRAMTAASTRLQTLSFSSMRVT